MQFRINHQAPVLGYSLSDLYEDTGLKTTVRKTTNLVSDYVIDPYVGNTILQLKKIPRRASNLSNALLNLDRSIPNLWNDINQDPLSLFNAFPITDFVKDVGGSYYKIGKQLAKSIWSWMINKLVNIIVSVIEWVIVQVGFKALMVYGLELLTPLLVKINALIASATAGIGLAISSVVSATTIGGIKWLQFAVGSSGVQQMSDNYLENKLKTKIDSLKSWLKNSLISGGSQSEAQISNSPADKAKNSMSNLDSINQGTINHVSDNTLTQIETIAKDKNEKIARKETMVQRESLLKQNGLTSNQYDLMIQAGFKNKSQMLGYIENRKITENNNLVAVGLIGLTAFKFR